MVAIALSGICATSPAAQRLAVRHPEVPNAGKSAAAFAPAGWQVETQASGDLNGDGAADLAFVLIGPGDVDPDRPPREGSATPREPNPRMLAVAFARAAGGYEVALLNREFLPRRTPPNGLSVGYMLFEDGSLDARRGRLRVIFEYTRGHRTYTFRWQDRAFRLIGYDSASVEGGCLHQLSINFLSRRAKLMAAYIDRDDEQVRWQNLAPRPLLTVQQISDGEEFDPYGLEHDFPLSCSQRP
ncbi:MAG TPA: hypothetical protein VFZ91_11280 [Allosphingosinicella sp.]